MLAIFTDLSKHQITIRTSMFKALISNFTEIRFETLLPKSTELILKVHNIIFIDQSKVLNLKTRKQLTQ